MNIKEKLRNHLIESSRSFNIDVDIDVETDSNYFEKQLNIIHKYFTFNKVEGKYTPYMVDLFFDTGFNLNGKYNLNEGVFDAVLYIKDDEYNFNFHPYDTMGGFNESKFEEEIKNIYLKSNNKTSNNNISNNENLNNGYYKVILYSESLNSIMDDNLKIIIKRNFDLVNNNGNYMVMDVFKYEQVDDNIFIDGISYRNGNLNDILSEYFIENFNQVMDNYNLENINNFNFKIKKVGDL